MKKIILTIMTISLICTAAFAKSSKSADQNKSDCRFEFGTDVSARFTGTAYVRNLIPLDNTYNWHGGSLNGTFAHIATNTNPEKPGVEWFEMLGKEDYNKLNEFLR